MKHALPVTSYATNSDKLATDASFPNVPRGVPRILIGGKIHTSGFDTREVQSFCTTENETISMGHTANVSVELLQKAADSAHAAWQKGLGDWPTAKMEVRVNAVIAFRDQMILHRELICRYLMWEIGKTWLDAQGEFDRTVQYITDTVEEVKRIDRDSARFEFSGGIMAQIRLAPLGVTLCMGPFNYPLNETFTTLIPALIMGNTVVVKIARYGQLLWDPLLEAFRDCFPVGVVNIVNGKGREIVGPVIRSGKIDVLAFIGSSEVASKIKVDHPQPHRFRTVLSLDAKNPAIVLPDADLENAVSECLKGALSFNGQRCTALKFILVHESIANAFTELLLKKVNAMIAGMPWDKGVQITPLPDANKPAYLEKLIQDAVSKGARIATTEYGAKKGTLFKPAVLIDVPLNCRLAQEEQFGPVIPIAKFKDLSEVEDYIVNSNFGAQVSIFGKDPAIVGKMIDHLSNQVCRINLNSQCQRGPDVFPFTGRKDSAEGTLSVFDALRAFSIRSMVAAKQDELGKETVKGILSAGTSNFLSTDILL